MSRDAAAGTVAAELHVRPSRLADAAEDVLVDLHRLETDGPVDEVRVRDWPGRVPLRSEAGDAVDRFREFRSWADRRDVSIQPPFAVRTVDSTLTGEHRTYLSTPVLCLAVRAGGTLEAVYPHHDGDEHHSVADGVAALAAGDVVPEHVAGAAGAPGPSVCSACGGDVVNVQGVRTCHDCRGVDRPAVPGRPALAPR